MSWYHTIDLPDGTTPGWFDTRQAPHEIEWPAGLKGARCLDVGTFDGFWAFELERRGAAEVVALDLDDPSALDWHYDERPVGAQTLREWGSERGRGFFAAADALGSEAKRVNRSVYDLNPEVDGMFDIVFCGALLLHLRDPIRALEAMRAVCRGELVLVEHVDGYLDVVSRRRPSAAVNPTTMQWWRTNSAGLVRMVERAGFNVSWLGKRFLVPHGPGSARVERNRWDALATGHPFANGLLYRALRGVPRAPLGKMSGDIAS